MILLLVALGGAVGAPLRYLADRFVQQRHDSVFPWGTTTVNVAGAALLGVLAGIGTALPGNLAAFLGTGFCGALTTYSTFGYETVRLAQERARFLAVANVAFTVVAGIGAAVLGYSTTASFAT
ncbi:MAG TPA: fluoride efflux transporter CrcB [Actinophytocola sp.]|uniref:fluoride efflux transporter CrcB n=1 Tax=Actinophytocola sp. TaxID=1872138 RepID=UPI002DDD8104|nr:fluoride efflux transporter CrcB [Actinophytocola sp.]HEV2780899.1 fluoride efflux transporter CrcB [Actinophytocola sp.]